MGRGRKAGDLVEVEVSGRSGRLSPFGGERILTRLVEVGAEGMGFLTSGPAGGALACGGCGSSCQQTLTAAPAFGPNRRVSLGILGNGFWGKLRTGREGSALKLSVLKVAKWKFQTRQVEWVGVRTKGARALAVRSGPLPVRSRLCVTEAWQKRRAAARAFRRGTLPG